MGENTENNAQKSILEDLLSVSKGRIYKALTFLLETGHQNTLFPLDLLNKNLDKLTENVKMTKSQFLLQSFLMLLRKMEKLESIVLFDSCLDLCLLQPSSEKEEKLAYLAANVLLKFDDLNDLLLRDNHKATLFLKKCWNTANKPTMSFPVFSKLHSQFILSKYQWALSVLFHHWSTQIDHEVVLQPQALVNIGNLLMLLNEINFLQAAELQKMLATLGKLFLLLEPKLLTWISSVISVKLLKSPRYIQENSPKGYLFALAKISLYFAAEPQIKLLADTLRAHPLSYEYLSVKQAGELMEITTVRLLDLFELLDAQEQRNTWEFFWNSYFYLIGYLSHQKTLTSCYSSLLQGLYRFDGYQTDDLVNQKASAYFCFIISYSPSFQNSHCDDKMVDMIYSYAVYCSLETRRFYWRIFQIFCNIRTFYRHKKLCKLISCWFKEENCITDRSHLNICLKLLKSADSCLTMIKKRVVSKLFSLILNEKRTIIYQNSEFHLDNSEFDESQKLEVIQRVIEYLMFLQKQIGINELEIIFEDLLELVLPFSNRIIRDLINNISNFIPKNCTDSAFLFLIKFPSKLEFFKRAESFMEMIKKKDSKVITFCSALWALLSEEEALNSKSLDIGYCAGRAPSMFIDKLDFEIQVDGMNLRSSRSILAKESTFFKGLFEFMEMKQVLSENAGHLKINLNVNREIFLLLQQQIYLESVNVADEYLIKAACLADQLGFDRIFMELTQIILIRCVSNSQILCELIQSPSRSLASLKLFAVAHLMRNLFQLQEDEKLQNCICSPEFSQCLMVWLSI